MTFTPRQFETLHLIREYRAEHGYSPTMQEMADALNRSKVAIFERISALESKKLIVSAKHRTRSIELTAAGEMLFKPLAAVEQVSLAAILKKHGIADYIMVRILMDVAAAGK